MNWAVIQDLPWLKYLVTGNIKQGMFRNLAV